MKKITFLIIILIFSCKSEKGNNTHNIVKTQFYNEIDSLYNAVIKNNEPGVGVLISYNDSIILSKGYGLKDLSTNQPITTSTNIRIGSISKQFTALGVLSLVEQGKLNLSDSIYNFFPYESLKNVTIQQLLTHQSGIIDADYELEKNWKKNRIATNQDIIDWYASHNSKQFGPEEKFEYNNAGYELLASLIEKVSGKEFTQYMKENIFKKANMKTTSFFNLARPIPIEERAFCYEMDSAKNWTKVDGHYLNGLLGAGGVYINLEDFASYSKALRKREILNTQIDSLLFYPQVETFGLADRDFYMANNTKNYYGFGWEINDNLAFHGGEWKGTNAFVIHGLKNPIDIAIFMNSNRLFESNLIDETYRLTEEFIKTTANNVYN